MDIFDNIPNALYPLSQLFAGIGGLAFFVFAIISMFVSKPASGTRTASETGGIIFGSIFLGWLAVGPIFTYEMMIFPAAQFPRPGFSLTWWIALAIIMVMGIVLMRDDIKKHLKLAWLILLSYLVLAIFSAAWVAKTVNVISHAFTVSMLAGILFGLLGIIYIAVYAFTPFMILSFALEKLLSAKKQDKKTATRT